MTWDESRLLEGRDFDGNLQFLGVDICLLHENRFSSGDHDVILSKMFYFSAYCDGRSRRISWLVSRSLKPLCTLVFADPADMIFVGDASIKDKVLRVIWVHAHKDPTEWVAFLWRIDPFLTVSHRVILAGDRNAILDPDLDRTWTRLGTDDQDVKLFRNFTDSLYLFDKFRNELPSGCSMDFD